MEEYNEKQPFGDAAAADNTSPESDTENTAETYDAAAFSDEPDVSSYTGTYEANDEAPAEEVPQPAADSIVPPPPQPVIPPENAETAPPPQESYDPFAEQDFAGSQPLPPPPPPVRQQYSMPYNNYGAPQYNNTPPPPYNGSQPYSSRQPQYNGGYPPYGTPPKPAAPQYAPQQTQYAPPPPAPRMYGSYDAAQAPAPAMPSEAKPKRLSTGGTVGIVTLIVALFMGLLILLAVVTGDQSAAENGGDKLSPGEALENAISHKADDTSDGDAAKVILPVKPKPVQEEQYYEDEATGRLTVAGVAKTVMPSVVDVEIYGDTTFYPDARASGIIISDDGYIITNAHVVSSVGTGIKVTLSDKREFTAELVGKDSKTDLAVIKIEPDDEGLTPAEIGEQVAAIGNSGGFSGTLTVGYVSGLNREVNVYTSENGADVRKAECIQTDAALSPGVSGGALVNMYGQVVGITTLKHQSSELDEGLGFAISINFAKPIIEDIISRGYITGRVRVGIMYTVVTSEMSDYYGVAKGILVSAVAEDCDISNSGLKKGDIITELNGVEVYNSETIDEALEGCSPGDVITAHVYRKGITDSDTTEFDISFELMQDKNLD